MSSFLFFFNDTATTEIYTLSLHDALPISAGFPAQCGSLQCFPKHELRFLQGSSRYLILIRSQERRLCSIVTNRRTLTDRKSTRLNSSHQIISYAVFCLKKKNKKKSLSVMN